MMNLLTGAVRFGPFKLMSFYIKQRAVLYADPTTNFSMVFSVTSIDCSIKNYTTTFFCLNKHNLCSNRRYELYPNTVYKTFSRKLFIGEIVLISKQAPFLSIILIMPNKFIRTSSFIHVNSISFVESCDNIPSSTKS